MGSFLALALSCHLSSMNDPVQFKAKLTGPDAENKYALTLTYSFYGANIDTDYVLTNSGKSLSGKSAHDAVEVKRLKRKSEKEYSLVIESNAEGALPMDCENN